MLAPEDARPYYQNDAAHDFDHVLRVLNNALKIAETEEADRDILQTAVLLHDIARADQEQTGVDHAHEGAKRARKILTDAPSTFVDAVCHAIETHRFRADNPPLTLEAKILYDADKLDSMGAVGVARVFAYAGSHNTRLWADDIDGDHTPLQEYRVKLVRLKDKLITASARRIATERHAYMVQFFERMAAEVNGAA